MREAAAVDHNSVGLFQLELFSNDGDMFYAGCTLNRRVIGVERMASDSVPGTAGLSDSDRVSLFFLALDRGGLSFDDLSL